MCKGRFLYIDILGPTCQLSLGQERSGEQHRKNTDNLWLLLPTFNRTTYIDKTTRYFIITESPRLLS